MPKHHVRLVTYAWGRQYVDKVLNFTLASVLSPGNLPALARAFQCEVVLVTEKSLFDYARAHRVFDRLQKICPVKLIALDDLIGEPWQYGISLAYALHRGMSDLGSAMTETFFLFLNGDFVLADGCYERLIPHIENGERAVLAPSYCVNEEQVSPLLEAAMRQQGGIISMPARKMAGVILEHRHNTIRAKTVNQRLAHFRYMDQFYWEAGKQTLLGFQMPISLIGMRPEVALPEVGTFWDWGVVYDFCPSKRLTVLGDSDQFLMLELRAKDAHEDSIILGWNSPREIASRMRGYITQYQVDNARFPLTLHAGALPPHLEREWESLRGFRDTLLACLPAAPIDHANHEQWTYHKRHLHAGSLSGTHEIARLKREIAQLEIERDRELELLGDWYEARLREPKGEVAQLVIERNRASEQLGERYRAQLGERKGEFAQLAIERKRESELLGERYEARFGERKREIALLEIERKRESEILEAWYESPLRERKLSLKKLTKGVAEIDAPSHAAGLAQEADAGLLLRTYRWAMGRIPYLRPWHPFYLSYKPVSDALEKAVGSRGRILFVCQPGSQLARAASDLPTDRVQMAPLYAIALGASANEAPFEKVVVELSAESIWRCGDILDMVFRRTSSGAVVLLHFVNRALRPLDAWAGPLAASLLGRPLQIRFTASGSSAGARAARLMNWAIRQYSRGSVSGRVLFALGLVISIGLSLLALIQEGSRSADRDLESVPQHCTSLTVTMWSSEQANPPVEARSPQQSEAATA